MSSNRTIVFAAVNHCREGRDSIDFDTTFLHQWSLSTHESYGSVERGGGGIFYASQICFMGSRVFVMTDHSQVLAYEIEETEKAFSILDSYDCDESDSETVFSIEVFGIVNRMKYLPRADFLGICSQQVSLLKIDENGLLKDIWRNADLHRNGLILDVDYIDENRIVTCSRNKEISVSDFQVKGVIRTVAGHVNRISGISYDHINKLLFSCHGGTRFAGFDGEEEKMLKVIDISSRNEVVSSFSHEDDIVTCTSFPEKNLVVYRDSGGILYCRDVRKLEPFLWESKDNESYGTADMDMKRSKYFPNLLVFANYESIGVIDVSTGSTVHKFDLSNGALNGFDLYETKSLFLGQEKDIDLKDRLAYVLNNFKEYYFVDDQDSERNEDVFGGNKCFTIEFRVKKTEETFVIHHMFLM